MIRFTCTPEERNAARRIAKRARKLDKSINVTHTQMDLIATHANGCPLDFAKLEAADDFNLMHDVLGIRYHLDRDDNSATAGKLGGCFFPRCHA